MKKVVANRWLKVEDKWYKKGDAFEVESLAGIPHDAVTVLSREPEEAGVEAAEEPKNDRRRGARK